MREAPAACKAADKKLARTNGAAIELAELRRWQVASDVSRQE